MRKNWGRVLGAGLCIIGLVLATYLAFQNAAAAFECIGSLPGDSWSCAVPQVQVPLGAAVFGTFLPSIFESPLQAGQRVVTILLGAIVACLFAVAFAGAAAVYILGWQPSLTSGSKGSRRRTMIAGTHRDAVFGTVIALLCVMTAGEYYLYAAAAKESVAWTPVLLIVEAAVFAFCFARFHKEFGISSISP